MAEHATSSTSRHYHDGTFTTSRFPEQKGYLDNGTPYVVQGREIKMCDECGCHTYMHSKAGRIWRTTCWGRIEGRYRRCGCKARFAKVDQ